MIDVFTVISHGTRELLFRTGPTTGRFSSCDAFSLEVYFVIRALKRRSYLDLIVYANLAPVRLEVIEFKRTWL